MAPAATKDAVRKPHRGLIPSRKAPEAPVLATSPKA